MILSKQKIVFLICVFLYKILIFRNRGSIILSQKMQTMFLDK